MTAIFINKLIVLHPLSTLWNLRDWKQPNQNYHISDFLMETLLIKKWVKPLRIPTPKCSQINLSDWFLKGGLPFFEFAFRFLQLGFQMPYSHFFLLQRSQILLWILWLNAVIVTTRIVSPWSPEKTQNKPSHNITVTVLKSWQNGKHPIDW